MSRTPRTFKATQADPSTLEPIPFIIEGTFRTSGDAWSETFTASPIAPAGVLDDLARTTGIDARGRRVWNAPSLLRFFDGVLLPEDRERFEDLMRDTNRIVELDALGQIMLWLSEELLGTPISPPSS